MPGNTSANVFMKKLSLLLKEQFPEVEIRHVHYTYEESIKQAVEELLAKAVKQLFINVFAILFIPTLRTMPMPLPGSTVFVNKRAKIICADQLGNQPAMREAYVQIIRDQLDQIACSMQEFS